MPSLSFLKGAGASYEVAEGKTVVQISRDSKWKVRSVQVGTGQLVTTVGRTFGCDISMLDPTEVQAEESVGEDGTRKMEVELANTSPGGLLVLDNSVLGALTGPAVHVTTEWEHHIWAFLLRPPWFPLRLQVDRPALSVEHGASKATASLAASPDGGLSAQVSVDGTDFKKVSLVVRRSLGGYSSDELVGETGGGTSAFSWKPIRREFDLVLVTGRRIERQEFLDLVRGLGFAGSRGGGDFVLCDGPSTSYSLVLRGHSGFLGNKEDQTGAKLAW